VDSDLSIFCKQSKQVLNAAGLTEFGNFGVLRVSIIVFILIRDIYVGCYVEIPRVTMRVGGVRLERGDAGTLGRGRRSDEGPHEGSAHERRAHEGGAHKGDDYLEQGGGPHGRQHRGAALYNYSDAQLSHCLEGTKIFFIIANKFHYKRLCSFLSGGDPTWTYVFCR